MRSAPFSVPLTKGLYESESLSISNRLCQNLFPNIPDVESTTDAQLLPTEGLIELEDTGLGNVNRGAHVMDGTPYFVNGGSLYRYDRVIDGLGNEIFNLVNVGVIAGNDRVSMDDNGTQLVIAIKGTTTAYVYTVAGGLVQITDPGFIPSPNATIVNGVKFVAGFFVFHCDNGVVFHSSANDGTSYNALDFFVYAGGKGDVVGLHEYKDQLVVFGNDSSAMYSPSNLTSNGSVFVTIQGYEFTKGLSSQFAVYDFDNSFVMIGQGVSESPKIYVFTGNDFQAISTTSIDYLLQRYTSTQIQQAFGFTYTFRGGTFAVFSLRDNTFVFESKATRLSGGPVWHERRSSNVSDKSRWRVNSLVTAYNRLLVGDSDSGIIGQLDAETYTEYGNTIFREFSLIVKGANGVMRRHRAVKIDIEAGISGYDDQSEIGLCYSDDGKRFTQWRNRECGARGNFIHKLQWQGFSATRTFRVYKVRMSDPVKYVIRDFILEVM